MESRVPLVALTLTLLLGGCAHDGANANIPKREFNGQVDSRQRDIERAVISMGYKLPSGVRVFRADSVAIHDGNTVAMFSAASTIVTNSSGTTIIDPESGQTFHFSSTATVTASPAGETFFLPSGAMVPLWAQRANARLVGQR